MLSEIVNNERTDKNTRHSYLGLYQELLVDKKETAKRVLEVGIDRGGSIKLWRDFFTNATVYGIDIIPIDNIWDELKKLNNIIVYVSTDAYDEMFFKSTFLDEGIKFDFMLDDGPHTIESMIQFIRLYSHLLTEDGILIIEDVQEIFWLDILRNYVPDELKQYVKTYDLRENKGRYDDIVFTIDKRISASV